MATALSALKSIVTASGVQIDKVVTKSGKTLWTRSTPYYAIQNGNIVNCPNASAWSNIGYNNVSGEVDNGYGSYYGGGGTTNEETGANGWGASTGTLSTNGCKYLYIKTYQNRNSYAAPTLTVTDQSGKTIHSIYISEDVAGSNYTVTLDVSAYTSVEITINMGRNSDDEIGHPQIGLVDVRLYD